MNAGSVANSERVALSAAQITARQMGGKRAYHLVGLVALLRL